jgi:hypothetical protein
MNSRQRHQARRRYVRLARTVSGVDPKTGLMPGTNKLHNSSFSGYHAKSLYRHVRPQDITLKRVEIELPRPWPAADRATARKMMEKMRFNSVLPIHLSKSTPLFDPEKLRELRPNKESS